MAHRGRLNVLVNILGKTPDELFSEFEGTKEVKELTGDVKYHLGFASDMDTPGGPVHLALAFTPSHLEIVGPVVEGSVRARQWHRGDREGNEVIPVQIHGDAAFSGQGVVMETLQMSQTRGYIEAGHRPYQRQQSDWFYYECATGCAFNLLLYRYCKDGGRAHLSRKCR